MKNEDALRNLNKINLFVLQKISESSLNKTKRQVPIVKLFTSVKNGANFKRDESVMDLAARGSKSAKNLLMKKIYEILSNINLPIESIDLILSGYYIDYYAPASSICSTGSDLIKSVLNKILLNKEKSSVEQKLKKLVQVVYQECYGFGILDEFRDLGIDANFNKVEEIAAFGPNQLMLKVSGVDYKLDKIYYPEELIAKVTNRLSRGETKGLNESNPKIESELLDQSRITLTGPPLNATNTFNIRLHYGNELTVKDQIRLKSTTRELENFIDLIMCFHPRIAVAGGQGTGKTTRIRDICRRYPDNSTILTAETSFELGLDNIDSLLVNRFKSNHLPNIEDLLALFFRQNAKVLVLGEARSPDDVMLFTQMAKRQAYGSVTTFHSDNPIEGITDMANTLLRGQSNMDYPQALSEVTKSIDFVIVQRVMEEGSKHPGKRHVFKVVEIPSLPNNYSGDWQPNVLFEYDYEQDKLVNVNPISEEAQKILLSRVYNKRKMEILQSGEYL